MKDEKNLTKSITVIAVVFFILAVAMVGAASAKSLYVIANHHTKQFDAWNINPDGTSTYQFKVNLAYASSPADIAIDESSNVLFITSEGGTTIEMVNATTMALLGHIYITSAGSSNGGIEADDVNDIVYMMDRGQAKLFALDWNPSTNSLTLKSGYPKTLTSGGYGIALDETTGILWVADGYAGKARAYSTTTWTEDTSKSSSTLIHKPVDIAVDRQRGFVYTVSMTYGAGTPPGTGSNKLSKYNVATGTETWGYLSGGASTHHGVGVAVDEITGYVYITTQNPYSLEVWDTSTSPSWTLVDSDSVSGSPAGVCIGQTGGFNPLGLAKDDGLSGACVNAGGSITYTMSYTNGNPGTVTGVTLTDTVPPEVTVTNTGGGTQSGNTVTWDIGTLTTGQSGSKTLDVTVNAGTAPGTTITNYATIVSDQTAPTTVVEQTDVCSGVGPIVESADSSGAIKNVFQIGESVYAIGSGYTSGATYTLYVMNDQTWTGGESLAGAVTTATVTIDGSGNIPATQIWASCVQGKYDIVVDVDGSVTYSTGDALDANVEVGFEAVPEFSTIAIPVASILGLLFFFNYRKRRREQ